MPHQVKLADMSVATIMSRWPETIAVFLALRMHCVGCLIAPFQTPLDAAREHLVDPDDLLAQLEAVISTRPPAPR